jgi:hypothetical protein
MCMDEIFAYDCCGLYICMIVCVCLIFQFKTGVKLKWGCVKPLVHNNFQRLAKTAKNRPVINRPPKLRPNNFR